MHSRTLNYHIFYSFNSLKKLYLKHFLSIWFYGLGIFEYNNPLNHGVGGRCTVYTPPQLQKSSTDSYLKIFYFLLSCFPKIFVLTLFINIKKGWEGCVDSFWRKFLKEVKLFLIKSKRFGGAYNAPPPHVLLLGKKAHDLEGLRYVLCPVTCYY